MKQSTGHVLMVRPASFGFNFQTTDNSFQRNANISAQSALTEFDNMVEALRSAGINVTVAEDVPVLPKPDAVFPNNWFSTCCNKLILYPMFAENRRWERTEEIIRLVQGKKDITDLSTNELRNRFLEGTGSLVLDHINRKAYAAISARTSPDLVNEWCALTGYTPVLFHTCGSDNREIYHTNVMMCIGTGYAVICLDAIVDAGERNMVVESLVTDGLVIIEISMVQMEAFAGNMLELEGKERLLLMSEAACRTLNENQLELIKKNAAPLQVAIPTIETIGGGSVRCMVAELF